MEHADADLQRVPPDICPFCEEQFQRVTSHWRAAASCEEPYLQPEQHQVLAGLLLVAGGIRHESGANPYFEMASTNRALLEWIADQFGVFTGDVREISRDPTSSGIDRIQGSSADFDRLHLFRTKALHQFFPYRSVWYDADEERCVPTGISPTPAMLRTAYAVAGGISDPSGRVHLQMTATDPSDRVLDRLFDGFAPRANRTDTSITVRLYNSTAFFDYIGEPVPPVEDKWPTDLAEPDRICPTCNGRFDSLGGHWVKNQSHDPPEIPPDLREMIQGTLLVGGRLKAPEDSVKRLHLASASRPLLEWVSDQFKWLSANILKISSEEESKAIIEREFDHELTYANAVYEFKSVSHPEFDRLAAQLETDPETVHQAIPRTPVTIGLLYARHGRHIREPGLYLNAGRIPVADDILRDLLAPWDPTLTEANDTRQVRIPEPKVDDFLDYVAEIPRSGDHSYPEDGDSMSSYCQGP